MTTEEMSKKLEELKENIDKALAEVTEYEKLIQKLKEQEEPKFERREGERYYTVGTNNGKAECCGMTDNLPCDEMWYSNNNYFYTEERAQQVADKINFLLKLERLHDIYCPDYVPNWEDDEESKWYVYYDVRDKEYIVYNSTVIRKCIDVYFDSAKTAYKVCDILNKEREENDERR